MYVDEMAYRGVDEAVIERMASHGELKPSSLICNLGMSPRAYLQEIDRRKSSDGRRQRLNGASSSSSLRVRTGFRLARPFSGSMGDAQQSFAQ